MANKRTPQEVARHHYEILCNKFSDMVASTTAKPDQFQLVEEKIRVAYREMQALGGEKATKE